MQQQNPSAITSVLQPFTKMSVHQVNETVVLEPDHEAKLLKSYTV